MYNIIFYKDKKGVSDIENYILSLEEKSKSNKESRIKRNKIIAYLDLLEEMGTRVGEPVTKHLDGEIWELRPLQDRFLYAYYKDDTFIILHYFVKKTQKTPKSELERAKNNLKDFLERNQ